jgi:hypothetical protein
LTGLSAAGEIAVLAAITTTAYVSLHSADPGTTGANEIVGNGYARQGPVTFTDSGFDPTTAANSAIVSFPTATAAWGSVPFFSVWTALSGGTYQGSGPITPAVTVNSGDQVRFLTGSLTLTAT